MFRPVTSVRTPASSRFAELFLAPGPQQIGATGDNSFEVLFGRNWLLVWDRDDGLLHLWQEQPGGVWLEVVEDLPPVFASPAPSGSRRWSLAFDQSARVILAYEGADGIVRVTRWDPATSQYVQNVSFSGADPCLAMDASWRYLVPDSDVLLFYLSSDRQKLMCRVQRDVYATPYEMWASTGGGGYAYEVFTGSGVWDWSAAGEPDEVDVLVVAGGGGGGSFAAFTNGAGGGGAGGLVIETGVAVSGNQTVTVGAGGAAGSSGTGGTGGNSSFGSLVTALGGGGGEGYNGSAYTNPGAGGSGGGAAGSAGARTGAAGTSGQGNAGGSGATQPSTPRPGAGGGGADTVGGSTTAGSAAGDGGGGVTLAAIGWGDATDDGAPASVAGGGGGGSFGTAAGAGGLGGGGAGSASGAGSAATANTGGGGGGSGNAAGAAGGAGGSGLVIVRYGTEVPPTSAVVLDRVIALPYRFQVLVSDSTGTPLPLALVSALYPVALTVGVHLAAEFTSGELRQTAFAYVPTVGVELAAEFVGGALQQPVTIYGPTVGVELKAEFVAGELKSVVTTYQPRLGVELSAEFASGALDEIGVPYTPQLGVELSAEFVGGVYEPG